MVEKRKFLRVPQVWKAEIIERNRCLPIKIRNFTPEGLSFESLFKIETEESEILLNSSRGTFRFKVCLRWIKPTDSGYVGGLKILDSSPQDKAFLLLSYLGKLITYLPLFWRVS
ncbi:MAG TPA: hypothetical protein ENI31_05465 [Candidatus Omnitrophica bacterium]|nr:MAG: hypothetical protein DRP69_01915 [Candidatus Omnitrophota bacterium]RKY44117.1 MAG: hypothetical protein DRP80_03280 [Candidatus Omnitrophota bacterium]HEC69710.1 hypothetical protein [Candidatus Omnitrophota bacterium]